MISKQEIIIFDKCYEIISRKLAYILYLKSLTALQNLKKNEVN